MCLRIFFCFIFSIIFSILYQSCRVCHSIFLVNLCEFITSADFLNMTELKILSYNTQGLGGIKKQIDVFQYIENKIFDICCLQDTHFTESQEIYIRNRWDGNCYFSPAAQANARGVAIFFCKKCGL